jgi:hypothetical protein
MCVMMYFGHWWGGCYCQGLPRDGKDVVSIIEYLVSGK